MGRFCGGQTSKRAQLGLANGKSRLSLVVEFSLRWPNFHHLVAAFELNFCASGAGFQHLLTTFAFFRHPMAGFRGSAKSLIPRAISGERFQFQQPLSVDEPDHAPPAGVRGGKDAEVADLFPARLNPR